MRDPLSLYPELAVERDRWIVERRGPREALRVDRPYAFFVEQERFANGEIGDVATVFLTNRECPWRCAMCDLWRHTLPHSVSPGDIPNQIEFALRHLPPARQIKLYNSGSFFDRRAIPLEDYPAIAALLQSFERVIVESHPFLIGESCLHLRDLISGQLEVAMGLETAHPAVLEKLNKRMTLTQYAAAADRLQSSAIALRAFVLVQPPFMPVDESFLWACRSIDFAFSCGASAITLIPTRGGNGATDEFALSGDFTPPPLSVMEDSLEYGIRLTSGRVFLDLWDLPGVACCLSCQHARIDRLRDINLSQAISPRVLCPHCRGSA